MKFLLDTNIILVYLKDKSTRDRIDNLYDPLGSNNIPILSIVSLGELESIMLRNNWGKRKVQKLEELLNGFLIADINFKDVIKKYAEIDAFSQGKLKDNPLNLSARNMGKNDLWIAATAAVTDSKLLTTDKDFDHLNGKYLDLVQIQLIK